MHAAPDALPFVDRHEVLVAAPPRVVWDALPSALPGSTAAGLYARAVGADPARASGALPGVGGTVPGFRVAEATAERHLLLTGRHTFSRYAGAHGLLVPRMLRAVQRRAERAAAP